MGIVESTELGAEQVCAGDWGGGKGEGVGAHNVGNGL
jgi:hypothetical protein